MMAQLIDRRQLKAQMKEMLRCAQVSPRGMTCLYLALTLVLNLADSFLSALGTGLLGTFVSILTGLMGMVLTCGYVLYCMAIRRGERAEYLTLFDGFSFVGKVILLNIVISLFTFLWGMLFVIPGIVAGYRYRFALYNLYENPGIGVMEALSSRPWATRASSSCWTSAIWAGTCWARWPASSSWPTSTPSSFKI